MLSRLTHEPLPLDVAPPLRFQYPVGRALMDVKLRTYLAETFGTFVLVAVAAGAVCSAYLPESPDAPRFYTAGGITVAAALAEGFALAVAVSFTSSLSPGCCNPAI